MSEQLLEGIYPLSPAQRGLLMVTLVHDDRDGGDDPDPGTAGRGLYVDQALLRLRGALDVLAWRGAWSDVVARHASLRTSFLWKGRAEPLQVVQRRAEPSWREVGLGAPPGAAREAELTAILERDRAEGFDLARAPLLRLTLVRGGPGGPGEESETWCVWTFHHLVVDGWSLARIVSEVLTIYRARVAGVPAELPEARSYREFIDWLARRDAAAEEAFWHAELAGIDGPTPLPFDGRSETARGDAGMGATGATPQLVEPIPGPLLAGARALARRHRVTLGTLFHALWGLLLARAARRREVVFGSVVSGRPPELPGIDTTVGLFINALPMRLQVAPEERLGPFLERLQDRQLALLEHQHPRLEEVARGLGLPQDTPLFESLVIFQNFPYDRAGHEKGEGLVVEFERTDESTHFPLALYVAPAEREPAVALSYDPRRWRAEDVGRLLRLLLHLLAEAVASPDARLGDLSLAGPEERARVLAAGRGPASPPGARSVLEAFDARAAETPERIAVAAPGAAWSYRHLAARSAGLAARLAAGCGPGDAVAIRAERRPELIAALLAVWRTGAAYLPLDPTYPDDRVAFMTRDSGARLLLRPGTGPPEELAAPGAARARPLSPDTAYVLYTSGSTGVPKGVIVPHSALASYVAGAGATFGLGPDDRVLQFASMSFDTSAEEIYTALTRGATLVLRPEEMIASYGGFLDEAGRLGVTVLDLPTSFWHQLVTEMERDDLAPPPALRLVILGGEEATADRLAAWSQRVGSRVRLLNTYGPTEGTIVSTCHDLTPADGVGPPAAQAPVPIGRPVPGVRALVLESLHEPAPWGLEGELWLGGAGLARGYLGRPALTADRFRPDPFAAEGEGEPGGRLYRTGDLARLSPAGDLEFLGRADEQVKVRGVRIEPGEVEAALRRLPGIEDAAVLPRPEADGRSGGVRLIAWLVATGPVPTPEALRRELRKTLPRTHVPSGFVFLDALPRTPSGKLDRRALAGLETPEPDAAAPPAAAGNPVEELVAALWGEVLGTERVRRDDSFFDLGGHSLLVAQTIGRIRAALGVEITLAEFFREPTVAGLAARVERRRGHAEGGAMPPPPPVRRFPRDGRELPLSYAQERVWFLDQLLPDGNTAYNFQVALWLWGPLDLTVLERSLSEIVRRHEVLRTTFPAPDGLPRQSVDPPVPVRLPVIDLRGLPQGPVRDEAGERLIASAVTQPFRLSAEHLIRWRLVRFEDDRHALVQVEHHFVHDGWSLAVLLGELQALYGAFERGEPSPLPERPIQYSDYAIWQREWMEGEVMERLTAFWRDLLDGRPAPLELPTDRPRPARGSFRGDILLLPLEPELYGALRRFGRARASTLYMTLLAGFLALLHRLTGQTDIVIGTSNANRRAPEIEGMIGMVVNTLVLRGDLSGAPDFDELVSRARELALAVHAHQDMPFERLVRALGVERRPGSNPLFQVMFNFHDAAVPDFRFADLEMFPEFRGNRTAKMDLNLIVVPRAEQRTGRGASEQDLEATLHWEYNTDLFDRTTVRRLSRALQVLLAGALADPRRAVAELPLLAPPERAQVLREWTDSARPYPREGTLTGLFGEHAERAPDAVAVAWEGGALSYGEVARRAARLARRLAAAGARPGDRIGLALERGPGLVPAVLAILECGAAYAPLPPESPAARLEGMAEDSGIRLVVTGRHLLGALPASLARGAVLLDGPDGEDAPAPRAPTGIDPESLAYVLYTSGSTGRPKGVMVTHRNVVRLVRGAGYVRFGPEETFLQLAPLPFDASTLEIWGPLLHGGRLVLHPPGPVDLDALGRTLARERVTTLWLTAGLFHQVVESGAERLAPVRQLLAGGDVLSPVLAGRLLAARPDLVLVDGYGPTESTTFTTCHRVQAVRDGATLPIGRPIANTTVRILDPGFRPAPIGAIGELAVGGDGVAVGYLGRPGLTAERFVPDPWDAPGRRLYRTGDLARWLPDGRVDFLGRADRQVKVRGFRIEPGEIESALTAHEAVAAAVVAARPDPGDPGAGRVLTAYVVADREGAAGAPEHALAARLRADLEKVLPSYMLPFAWVFLDELPLDANGKVDRDRLPDPQRPVAAAEGDRGGPPEGAVEAAVAEIWEEVLSVSPIERHDDFFLLGGHSLTMVRILARLRDRFGDVLSVAELFEHPTVATQAALIEERRNIEPDAEELDDEQLDALLARMLAEDEPA